MTRKLQLSMSSAQSHPERLGRYRILGKLGQGGMATVYRAIQEGPHGFESEVAIKLFHKSVLSTQPNVIRMIVDEARVASRLHHAHIVRTLDLVEEDDFFYTVMDFVDGLSMRQVLDDARRTLRTPDVAPVVETLGLACRGLDAAHTAALPRGDKLGLVHRDIKPGNILVSWEGQVKVTDFGIALFSDRLADATEHGQLKGTPAYMSPEQVFGEPMDARSDIFSMGLSLYTLCTTRLAFSGETPMRIAVRIAEEPMDEHADELDSLLPGLGPIFLKACAKTPDERFQTAEELGEALLTLHATLDSPQPISEMLSIAGWGREHPLDPTDSLGDEATDSEITNPNLASLQPGGESTEETPTNPDSVQPKLEEEPTEDTSPTQPGSGEFDELQDLAAGEPTLPLPAPEPATSSRSFEPASTTGSSAQRTLQGGASPASPPSTTPQAAARPDPERRPAQTAAPASPTASAHSSTGTAAGTNAAQTTGAPTRFQPERDYRGRVVRRKVVDPASMIVSRGEKAGVILTAFLLLAAVVGILIAQKSGADSEPPQEQAEAPEATDLQAPDPVEAKPQEESVEPVALELPSTEANETKEEASKTSAQEPAPRASSAKPDQPETLARRRATKMGKDRGKKQPRTTTSDEPAPAEEAIPGSITVNSYPYAEVFINGTNRGRTPIQKLDMPEGMYEVRLVFPTLDNEEHRQKVRVRSGSEASVFKRMGTVAE
ncbi:MAG: protein kinase [Myxococcota bacterium]|nr:protein kinase [Myxococcota bacterium]